MDPWIRLLDFLDKHPVASVVVLVSVSVVLAVVGLPLPKRTQKQTLEGVETTWSLNGGVPGIGPGLVAIGRAIVDSSKTNAAEREASRNAHAAELQAHKAAIEAIKADVAKTNNVLERFALNMQSIAADLHALVGEVKRALEQRESPVHSTDRASAASCTSLSTRQQSRPG